jgi:hypothetical protein
MDAIKGRGSNGAGGESAGKERGSEGMGIICYVELVVHKTNAVARRRGIESRGRGEGAQAWAQAQRVNGAG